MNSKYILCNLKSLESQINEPSNGTQRIKYTCMDASQNYIILGATSGSLYVFQRLPCKLLLIIQNVYGSVTNLVISPQEKFIAFSTDKGSICIYVINLTAAYPQIVTAGHKENTITCLHWKRNEEQLFFGDNSGNVCLVNLQCFLGRTLTSITIYPILMLETSIVQICDFDKLLLISNCEKCILCNTETEQFKQIGNSPRHGYYGACFLTSISKFDELQTKIYCARPGIRLWESDLDGNILQTNQYKIALNGEPMEIVQPPSSTKHDLPPRNNLQQPNKNASIPQNLQLSHLQTCFGQFIFSYTKDAFYMFDPNSSHIVLWNDQFRDIQNIKVISDNTLIVYTSKAQLFSLNLRTLENGIVDLINEGFCQSSVPLIMENKDYLLENLIDSASIVQKLRVSLGQEKITKELDTVLNEFLDHSNRIPSENGKQLTNSVYLVDNLYTRNKHPNELLLWESKTLNKKKLNSNFLNRLNMSLNTKTQASDDIVIPKRPTAQLNNNALIVKLKPLSGEEKLIQNLFMIYKTSQISGLPQVDRYATIFDRYDYLRLEELLSKLSVLMIENGESNDEAKRHCYEMYFNYINLKILETMDESFCEYIASGFIQVNDLCEKHDSQRCTQCNFPIFVEPTERRKKFEQIGIRLFKHLWLVDRKDRCYEIASVIPWTIELIINLAISDKQINEKLLLLLFTYPMKEQFENMVGLFNDMLWESSFDVMISLHNSKQIKCSSCQYCDNNLEIDTKSVPNFSWSYFLNCMIDKMRGRSALRFLQNHSKDVKCDESFQDFYLKCLLKP